MTDELDFNTPRRSTARMPIFCRICKKQGYMNSWGSYSGPTMRLTAYLAGAPKVCRKCDRELQRPGLRPETSAMLAREKRQTPMDSAGWGNDDDRA